MPFTFAHPAAAVPLLRPLGRWASLSALVIGSMTPDFWYLFPHAVGRGNGHSFAGLFWFCLPAGIVMYLLFHFLIKQPVLSVLPTPVATRLAAYAGAIPLARIAWPAVLVSLCVGAATHISWDAFTHGDGPGVLAIPLLRTHLFSVASYDVPLYKLLQHASTLLGLSLLTRWSWRWLRTAPIQTLRLSISFSPLQRGLLLATLLALPVIGALLAAAPVFSSFDVLTLPLFAKSAVLAGIAVAGMELLLFSVCWQVALLRRRSGMLST